MAANDTIAALREEKKALKQAIADTTAALKAATTAHDAALQAYENWKTRILNVVSSTEGGGA